MAGCLPQAVCAQTACIFAFLIPEAMEFAGAQAMGVSHSQPLSFLGEPQELSALSGPQFTPL